MKNNIKKPFLIAGPCSAESEKQLFATAKKIKQYTDVFRAGLWKARTNPSSFSGVGEKGLPWLQRINQKLGLKTSTEIANSKHIEKCLEYNIDMLWIGARTVANPFAINEIAHTLKGTDKTIIIKNPIHPDLQAWIGAVQRLEKMNIKKIILVHRGFFIGSNKKYRNDPMWEMALKIKKYFPGYLLLCDPSHISGNKNLVYKISKEALLKHKMDGLMIEARINPEKSLSDKNQHINTFELKNLYASFIN